MKSGATLIAQERKRQIEVEGFDKEHDEDHSPEVLASAGVCYALDVIRESNELDNAVAEDLLDTVVHNMLWPWEGRWWKPKDRLSNYIRAGALIAAAIDKILTEESH